MDSSPSNLRVFREELATPGSRASELRVVPSPEARLAPAGIVGSSAVLQHVLRQVELVAPTDSVVLIHGETGTGKELVARAIHRESRRAGPFVSVNIAAIPTNLWESEIFGHERGAFTGAASRRIGRFEEAGSGTIFLDEIGELDCSLQPKLLRLLQERQFQRVGGVRAQTWNARLVVATNRDLREMVESDHFRADLYYRLNVFQITLPPLRERPEDIPCLALHFARAISTRMGRPIPTLTTATLAKLKSHVWPGNVRELQNVIESAIIRCDGPHLDVLLEEPRCRESFPTQGETLELVDRAHILRVLEQSNWVIAGQNGAAARLGLKRTTLNHRMKKLGIFRTSPRYQAVDEDTRGRLV
jgi:formate hydrogenlyase transcriptional activator